ncbi:MAG TPA: metallophosphoesterase [Polyangiaceae bacterium]|nr:metallophosphoesterase [Polyangiaceae bacterium]
MTPEPRARRCGFRVAVALCVLALGGCDRAPEPTSRSTRSAPLVVATQSAAGPKIAAPERSFRYPASGRVVAIGDVHGDLQALREALRLASATDDRDRWVGGKLVVVQTGDQLDRGDQERRIIDWLDELAVQAKEAGGALHALNGNHEIMNVAGDFRYVTPGGFAEFSSIQADGRLALELRRFPETMRGRVAAFAPGGPYARRLAKRDTVAIVGDTAFAHGGILPAHVDYGLGRLNAEVSRWMQGDAPAPPSAVLEPESPVWTRVYGEDQPSAATCERLKATLSALSVRRLVVGHTVQKAGITAACSDSVYRIDVGLAKHYGDNVVQVLQIDGERVEVLRRTDTKADAPSIESGARR